MIRRHLDFVADFTFHPSTPDAAFNERLARLMGAWERRTNCDPARRHPLRRLMRIAECCRCIDGDLLWVKLRRGQVQLVRGDRIRNQLGFVNTVEWKHGVHVDRNNAAIEYAVHTRTPYGQMVFERMVPARNAIHHGYFDDPDQVRGVSPVTVALRPLQDVYENFDYALARAKLSQLIGLVITRKAVDLDAGDYFGIAGQDERKPAEQLTEEEQAKVAAEEDRYERINYGAGPWQLELDVGDDAKFLESAQPSATFQQFNLDVILAALKALDLPFSFYREDFTNFYGSRGALQMYRRSCRQKQEDNRDVLDEITAWKVRSWIASGQLELPPGWTIDNVEWEWVVRGIEWWDKAKEIQGDLMAIAAGLDTPQRVCRDHGSGDFERNILERAKAEKFARDNGVVVSFAPAPAPADAADSSGDDVDEQDQDEQKPAPQGKGNDGAKAA